MLFLYFRVDGETCTFTARYCVVVARGVVPAANIDVSAAVPLKAAKN